MKKTKPLPTCLYTYRYTQKRRSESGSKHTNL